ncbi:MAG TPA: hypothetical protein ENG87_04090 [Candidatus Pacearchaeota archaeon]|nr:hypothetical protein BMS3Abin17_00789 [archaeon BMS3Abin17]HDK42534.1 hypothetical protein [Candidatus Pacearchaeota archaeon]HDZ60551.1 hypothetical protein [Candidatus Pacearchaeota archaeon]
MELGELINLEGVKVVDSNIFSRHDGNSVLKKLYDCKSIQQFPADLIFANFEISRNCRPYLKRNDVFSIPEVAEEMEYLLDKLNYSLAYFSSGKYQSFGNRYESVNNRRLVRLKRMNKHREKQRIHREHGNEKDHLNILNNFAHEVSLIVKLLKNKEVTNSFTEEEKTNYDAYLGYFIHVAKREKLKNPSDSDTDEKLVSAAFTLANKDDVILISSDVDIRNMIKFFHGDKKYRPIFNIGDVKKTVSLYADPLREGYKRVLRI